MDFNYSTWSSKSCLKKLLDVEVGRYIMAISCCFCSLTQGLLHLCLSNHISSSFTLLNILWFPLSPYPPHIDKMKKPLSSSFLFKLILCNQFTTILLLSSNHLFSSFHHHFCVLFLHCLYYKDLNLLHYTLCTA